MLSALIECCGGEKQAVVGHSNFTSSLVDPGLNVPE